MRISLLTGGDDPSYALPLLASLIASGLEVDFIGNDMMRHDPAVKHQKVRYLNLRGDQSNDAAFWKKIARIIKYYFGLIKYAATTDSKIFHILWLNKFVYFDRTLLNVYYKLMGKKIVFTAHNINDKERDGGDNALNRYTLRFMYTIADHIFVHTDKMKQQLADVFHIDGNKVTVIPFGINNHVPNSALTSIQAKQRLNVCGGVKTILFFGQIAWYKGLDTLISTLVELRNIRSDVKLVIAGKIKKGFEAYWTEIQKNICDAHLQEYVITKVEFIPDKDVETYFKAADALILPYRSIFQTGLLYLAYNFGLPAIATDVGSLKEDIIVGETGFVCRPNDPKDLATKINMYFQSGLFENLEESRNKIIKYAREKYSWDIIGEKTHAVYEMLE